MPNTDNPEEPNVSTNRTLDWRVDINRNQLQSKFKHASDFGVDENWNSQSASNFDQALRNHVYDNQNVVRIQGTYRGQYAIHYVDEVTGNNVITYPDGRLWSAWRLSANQITNVITRRSL